MNPQFNHLKKEKQETIINAALKEFAENRYEKASTNKIVQEAGISKGSLFNYFENKKELYLYLTQYSAEIIEKIYEVVDLYETDLFKKLESIGIAKLKIQQQYPQVFDFLYAMTQEEAEEVAGVNQKKVNAIYKEGLEKIYENIDYSKFKDDVDVKKAMDILNWSMFGFGNRAIEQIDSMDEVEESYLKEWEEYSALLKKAFYK